MSPTGKFTFKLVIYGAFLLYLVGDLFLWHGFLAGRMDAYLKPMPGPPGDNSARIAEVYGEPVTANVSSGIAKHPRPSPSCWAVSPPSHRR